MGDKIKPHPSDCSTCAPGSPHAASNAAISEHVTRVGAAGAVEERAAAEERERVAFLHAKCADLGEALLSALVERDEARAVRANQEATIEDLGEALASALDERDEARAKLAEVQRERDEARNDAAAAARAARAAVYEARVGWRVSERLRAQSDGEVARLRCFAEGLAQGLSVPAAGASSGLCRVCLTARPPLAEVATVTTRGASGEVLHFCEECWGLTAAGHSGVAR